MLLQPIENFLKCIMTDGDAMQIDGELPPFSLVCNMCKNLDHKKVRVCKAFPKGIPAEIWLGLNDHTKPYEGDHGIQFESEFNGK